MHPITEFEGALAAQLPETYRLLQNGHLVVHEAVSQIVLSGSRGLNGRPRPDSDIDLSLIIASHALPPAEPGRERLLRAVLNATLSHWKGEVELDVAAVFDRGNCCGLRCFNTRDYDGSIIQNRGVDCFGILKVQHGYVTSGVNLKLVYPMLVIWRQELALR